MIEAAVIVLRLLQYAAGSILMGSALFVLYALPHRSITPVWGKPLLVGAALTLTVSAMLSYLAQTAYLAGSWQDALTLDALGAMLSISLGKAALVRMGVSAIAALVLITRRARRSSWVASAVLGTIAVATFAWMGHGADSQSWIQLIGDLIHVLAAATWMGALVTFLFLLQSPVDLDAGTTLHAALLKFSSIGVVVVALLVLSGLSNGWFLVGIDNLSSLFTTAYGRLLLIKLALFIRMLVLAAQNRSRHTLTIERTRGDAASVRAAHRSVSVEFAFGLAVLGLVAWFGTLEPPVNGG